MHTQLYFCRSSNGFDDVRTMIFIGRRDQLISDEVLGQVPDELRIRWPAMVDSVGAGDAGGSTHTWLSGDDPQKVVAAVLPEPCSRHNSPARPHAIASLVRSNVSDKGDTGILVALESPEYATASASAIAQALSQYSRKSSTSSERKVLAGFISEGESDLDLDRFETIAREIRLAARLVDMPASELHTDAFVDLARQAAVELGCEISVLQGEELARAGMGGLWGVGRAAIHQPALVVLDHIPAGADPDRKTIAWVGKGIVYDTGGLSIKTKNGMPGMKADMGGAAAVLAAFRAAVKLEPRHRIIALLCLAENSVGPDATRPDDILEMYSGRTVEVNNTDAEGRLVLADGVAYVTRHYKADLIIDLATLTGAQLLATGKKHAAIMCNDEEIESLAIRVGKETGDLVHPLPYAPEFFRKEFKSSVADMKNSVKDRMNAQASCAGQFVGEHLVDYENAWLHVDLAGPARPGERGTGFGTSLLIGLLDAL